MSAKIIDGKAISMQVRDEMLPRIETLKNSGIMPCLAVILVGEDPASKIYVKGKEKAFAEIGMLSRVINMPEETSLAELLECIAKLNNDSSVHGILVQMPLPVHISRNEKEVLEAISPAKDVDGFHPYNFGRLFSGHNSFVPGTPKGIIELLKRSGVEMAGAKAVVVGRSNIVGKPIAMLLLSENATVTLCHSKTKELAEETRKADILIVAIGRKGFITGDMIKPGAAVIDVGINRAPGSKKIYGDVDFASAEQVAGYITPVPGGVGPMTITMLLVNTLEAAENAARG